MRSTQVSSREIRSGSVGVDIKIDHFKTTAKNKLAMTSRSFLADSWLLASNNKIQRVKIIKIALGAELMFVVITKVTAMKMLRNKSFLWKAIPIASM
jgi:hypothetical protein